MATCSFFLISSGVPCGENRALVHHDDAVGVLEHHVHVVLDDHGGDALAAHDRGDGVHDLALVARAHAAGRLVEEQELRPQRVGERHVEQLALALREAAREHRCACRAGRTGRARRSASLRTSLIEVGERRRCRGLAFAREDRQRDIVEGGELVEQVDDLEAARDAGLDALGHGATA